MEKRERGIGMITLLWKYKGAIASAIIISCLLGVIAYQREVIYPEYYQNGYKSASENLTSKHNEELAKLTQSALEKERYMQNQLSKLNQTIVKERENAKIANANMRNELNRLQSYIKHNSEAVKRASATTKTTNNANAQDLSKGWVLFGECSKRYAEVATVADEYRNDLIEWQNYGKLINQNFYNEDKE